MGRLDVERPDYAMNTIPASAPESPCRAWSGPISAGVLAWLMIAAGFLGLRLLMDQRPQFVGEPGGETKATLLQESPDLWLRKVTDDVSVIKTSQPERAEVQIDMRGRRDHRGLRTITDMAGRWRAVYRLTNPFDEPAHLLFRCPHPKPADDSPPTLRVAGLRLLATPPGVQEHATDAWLWSGTLPAKGTATVEVAYEASSLAGLSYRVRSPRGQPARHLRIAFGGQDLGAARFESSDGPIQSGGGEVVWERMEFLAPAYFAARLVEGRSLYTSLSQLVEIGPVISLLFLLAVLPVLLIARGLTVIQVFTLAAAYILYFPLILYLSSRFAFPWALAIAVLVPGALLLNYARHLLGGALGWLGGALVLGLYQVFPTLAAFSGWNRGMVLLSLGVITLSVLIHLQNRALVARVNGLPILLAGGLAAAGLAWPRDVRAAELPILVPGSLATSLLADQRPPDPALLSFRAVTYQVDEEATYLRVEADLGLEVVRGAAVPVTLFGEPIHLTRWEWESTTADLARLVTASNRIDLLAENPGGGTLRLSYRVPLTLQQGRQQARIPLVPGAAGTVRLRSSRPDVVALTGQAWSRIPVDGRTSYDIGVAGIPCLVLEWGGRSGDGTGPSGTGGAGVSELYGIGITRAQHLTVINSDGTCTHFAEIELPPFHEVFEFRPPPEARLISVLVNGTELKSPPVSDGTLRLALPRDQGRQAEQRLSFRLAYPPHRLGFVGALELDLPEVRQTIGTLEWTVALPVGFDLQLIASGLDTRTASPQLARFGEYGQVLDSHPKISLLKSLAPPGPTSVQLGYRQRVEGRLGDGVE